MRMVKKEWKEIYSNKILLLSCVVILFIPILYAGFFLKSNWDPYGNTDKLSVAVVNEDQQVNYEGEKLAVGADLVENLKNNNALDWHFITPREAEKGLENRKYYMVMTIPKDFSKNASTLMDQHPEKMKLTYKTNGSLNFIGEVISKSAVKEVKMEVSQNVTKAYTEALFDQIGEVGDGFTEAGDGSEKLKEGTKKLTDGNKEITKNLTKLADSTLTFNEGADALTIGLKDYTDGVAQLDLGAMKLNKGIGQLASSVEPLKNGMGQLNNGATDLTAGLTAYTAGVSQLNSGAGQLVANNSILQNGVGSLSNGVDQVKGGSDQLLAGLKQLSSQLATSTQDKEKAEQLKALQSGLPKLNEGIQTLNSMLNDTSSKVNTSLIKQDLTKVGEDLVGMEPNLTTASVSLSTIGVESNKLAEKTTNNTAKTIEIIEEIKNSDNLKGTQQAESLTALQVELQNQEKENTASIETIANQTGTTGGAVQAIAEKAVDAGASAKELQTQLEELADLTTQLVVLKAKIAELATGSNQVLPGASQAITELQSGLTSVQTALMQTGEGQNKGVIQGMTELNQGLMTIQNGLKGNDGLVAGITIYTNGVKTLKNGTTQLETNSGALNTGAAQLNNGINQVVEKLPLLADGVNQLDKGSNQLVKGTRQLTDNSGKLIIGSEQLADGAEKITDGSTQLANGSAILGDGLTTLSDGTTTLATSLQEGANKVNTIDPSDETFRMFSNPTELIHKEFSHVPNYGAALAPYIMSMALYIGAVVFNVIYPIRKQVLNGQSGFSFWLAKLSVALPIASLMAIIEAGILMALGLQVQSVGKFFVVAMVTALAFMAIVTFLTVSLDNVGRFIAMILLVVQLGGAGGTFPMPLTNQFFISIHPFLPMSYSIYGFREAISGGIGQDLFNQSMLVLTSLLIVFSSILFIYLHIVQKRKQNELENNEYDETVKV